MNALAGLLPDTAGTDAGGRAQIGGCSLAELAETFGTPAYLVDEQTLRRTARDYLGAFRRRHPASDVFFASKALPCPGIIGVFTEEGLGCDVASANELALALAGGMPAERMLLHGNAKTDADLGAALAAGVGLIVLDGTEEIDRLVRLAPRTGPQPVLLRVNPGVDAATHAAMATGHDGSKFGVPAADVPAVLARIEAEPSLRLAGLHVHVGSQITDLAPFADSVARLAALGPVATLDLGGGLGVRYTAEDPEPPHIDEYAARLLDAVHRGAGHEVRVIVEPGRSLVARAGVTLYGVVTVKRGGSTFVAVDGGMGDNLEPALYGQRFAAAIVDPEPGRALVRCAVVGPHCETGDRLVGEHDLADPRAGDLLLVPVTGAYCHTMANNYNGALRPPVVLCDGGEARVLTRRETLADLMARHVVAEAPTSRATSPGTSRSRCR